MVSPELLHRYTFFTGFSNDEVMHLARAAEEAQFSRGQLFFYEGDELNTLYLLLEGSVELSVRMPDQGTRAIIPPPTARAREMPVSVVRASEVFAWSALVPPYRATSNCRAAERCRVIAFNGKMLRESFRHDPRFGYQMLIRVAQIARDRIQDMHYEALAHSLGE